MEFVNEHYHVVMTVEQMPRLEQFNIVHNPKDIKTGDFYMARVLRISKFNGETISVALLDIVCSGYDPCAVLEGNIMTVILFSAIVRIDLDTGLIVQYVECDNMGGLFEIYPIDNGYIIWGEGGIFRYDFELNRVWFFSGRDILVSLIKDKHFWIEDDLIHCRDFDGWHYILNFDGKLLCNFLETSDSETL